MCAAIIILCISSASSLQSHCALAYVRRDTPLALQCAHCSERAGARAAAPAPPTSLAPLPPPRPLLQRRSAGRVSASEHACNNGRSLQTQPQRARSLARSPNAADNLLPAASERRLTCAASAGWLLARQGRRSHERARVASLSVSISRAILQPST